LIGNSQDNMLDGYGGNNILVGNAGNDWLYGGFGRNLLIGGTGADHVFGNGGDDIVIGGTTSWDSNESMLWSILNTWSWNLTYQQKIDYLYQAGYLNYSTVSDDQAA